MKEDELVQVLDSFKEGNYSITLFVSDKKVDITDMPRLVLEIKQIEQAIVTNEEWADPTLRNTAIQQPNIQPQRRNSSPRRHEPHIRDNSSRKLKQRFTYQFKSFV